MRLSSTLVEIGAASPTVLDTLLSSDHATALETARRAACTGARDVLEDPPPALLHPSKFPTVNMLYCAKLPSPVQHGPYMKLEEKPLSGDDCCCIGTLMMQVTKDSVLPAVLFVQPDLVQPGGYVILVEVYSSPLSAMEAELFGNDKSLCSFEREWIGEEASSAKELRRQIGQWVHMQGYDQMPQWMHDENSVYGVCRPGVLPLLRLRKAETSAEAALLKETLEKVPRPGAGVIGLRELLTKEGDTIKIRACTVFTTQALHPLESPSTPHCGDATGTIIGPLALAILKNFTNEDYYGIDKEDDEQELVRMQQGDDVEEETQDDPNAARLQQALEAISTQEGADPVAAEGSDPGHPGLAYQGNKVLMRLVGPTGRTCDSKLIVRTQQEEEAAEALVARALCGEDAELARLQLSKQNFLGNNLAAVARVLEHRYAFLVLTKEKDGTLSSCYLYAHDRACQVSYDAVTRYVLCPWVMPVVLDGEVVSELLVRGVKREQFRLTPHARQQALKRQAEAGRALAPEVVTFIREASEGLKALPDLAARLGAIETAMKTVPPDNTAAPATSGARAGPSSEPPTEPVEPPAVRQLSQAHRGFKRMCELIDEYERNVAQRGD